MGVQVKEVKESESLSVIVTEHPKGATQNHLKGAIVNLQRQTARQLFSAQLSSGARVFSEIYFGLLYELSASRVI